MLTDERCQPLIEAAPQAYSPVRALAKFGLDTLIRVAGQEGRFTHELPLRFLLPEAFLPQELQG